MGFGPANHDSESALTCGSKDSAPVLRKKKPEEPTESHFFVLCCRCTTFVVWQAAAQAHFFLLVSVVRVYDVLILIPTSFGDFGLMIREPDSEPSEILI